MNKIYMMMGIPGSGKSTYAKSMIRKEDLYISRDEIRFSLLKDGDAYFSKEKEVLKSFINKIKDNLNEKEGAIFVDATNLNCGSRAKILKNIDTNKYKVSIIYLNTPIEVAIERNSKRDGIKKVPLKSIKTMYSSIELPKKEEGIEKIIYIGEKCMRVEYL